MELYDRLDQVTEHVIQRGSTIHLGSLRHPEGIREVLSEANSLSAGFAERRLLLGTVTVRLVQTSCGNTNTHGGYTSGTDRTYLSLCFQGIEGEQFWANKLLGGRSYVVPHGFGDSSSTIIPEEQWQVVTGNTFSPERLEGLFQ